MLPPIDPAVAAANPAFGQLYLDLTTRRLNARGATVKITDGDKPLGENGHSNGETAHAQALARWLHDAAEKALLTSALWKLAQAKETEGEQEVAEEDAATGLSEPQRHHAALLAAVLDGKVPRSDWEVVDEEIERHGDDTESLALALSRQFERDAETLAQLLPPNDDDDDDDDNVKTKSKATSTIARPSKSIATALQTLQTSIATLQDELRSARLDLAASLTSLHSTQRDVLQRSVLILEQTLHGSVARGTRARSDYLAAVAEGMAAKLALQHAQVRRQVHSDEMQGWLRERMEGLQGERKELRRRLRGLEERLEEYGRDEGMRQVAREFAQVGREIEKVRGDVERLRTT